MNKYENYVAGEYLSDWPHVGSFEELLQMIRSESDQVDVYHLYEDLEMAEVADAMSASLARLGGL